jgi:HK97 family phage major capsid protein
MPGWETTDEYHRHRIREPGEFDEDTFKTTDFDGQLPDGIKVIRGKLRDGGEWATQSIIFEKSKWSLEEAKKWYEDHKDSVKIFESDMQLKFGQPIEFKLLDDNPEDWIIEGYASTDDIDADGDKILPTAFEKSLPKYMENPVLMLMHPLSKQLWMGSGIRPGDVLPIGKITEATIKIRGLWVKAQISKTVPKIWTLIKEGILKSFSVGFGELTQNDVERDGNIKIIKNLLLIEISIVPRGKNLTSLFEIAEAKGINLKSLFTEVKHEDNEDLKVGLEKKEEEKNKNKKEDQVELDVKLKQDLENGLAFINQIKEKVQEIATKAELKEFEDRVKVDLLRVMDDQTKRRRKIEFEAELDADPYVDSSPLNHPQIWMARTPQQKFANLVTLTTKNQKVKEMQMAADDLLLTHIVMKKFASGYGGIKSLRMFDRYSQVSSDFRKALDTATAGEGLEWIPTGFSAELIDKVRLELKVAGLFQQFAMPTNPFKYPLLTGDVTMYYMPESLADLSEKIPASNVTTAGLTFTAIKLAARILCSDEITEDSIVAILPILKNDLAKGLAEGLEDVIINGDTTSTHQDSDVTNAKDRRKAFKGLRKLTATGAKYDAGAFTAADVRQVRGLMGKYAVNPADCVIVTSIAMYLKSFLSFTEVATVDKFGEQATWLKGYLTALDGMPLIVSEKVRQDLNASGVYDGVTTTKSIFAIVNKSCYLIGNRRLVTIKQASDIETDQEILVITQRLDFQPKYTAASEYAVGIGYNIVPGV